MTVAAIVLVVAVIAAQVCMGGWFWNLGRAYERKQHALAQNAEPQLTAPPEPLTLELDDPAIVSVRRDDVRDALIIVDHCGASYILAYPYSALGWRSWPSCDGLDINQSSKINSSLEKQLLRVGFPALNVSTLIKYLQDDTNSNTVLFVDSSEKIVSTGYRTTETAKTP